MSLDRAAEDAIRRRIRQEIDNWTMRQVREKNIAPESVSHAESSDLIHNIVEAIVEILGREQFH